MPSKVTALRKFLEPFVMAVAFLTAFLVAQSSAKFEEAHVKHCWRFMA